MYSGKHMYVSCQPQSHTAFDDMEREWKIGRVINLLNNPTFMFTGPCIRGQNKKLFAGGYGGGGGVYVKEGVG